MIDRLFADEALFFTVPALLGTLVFLIKLGMMTIGGHVDMDADVDVDVDVDPGVDLGHDVEAGDSDAAFNLLSIQSIATLLGGFGWGGLGGLVGLDWGFGASLGLGVAFGVAMAWLLGLLMKGMYDLQRSGNVRIDDAIGCQGAVYAGVPEKGAGRGQVRVVIRQRSRIYNAISDGEAIKTGTRVRVTGVNDDNSLTVTAA